MRQVAIITSLVLILSLALACTESEQTREPEPTNIAQANPSTTQPSSNPTPTATLETRASLNCDSVLRNQLVFQRGASNADRMNVLVSRIQSQHPECDAKAWNPTAVDLTLGPTVVSNCYGTADTEAAGSTRDAAATASRVGNADMPHGLLIQTGPGYESPARSGRDEENNIIVYFDLKASKRPADGASCWLYHSGSKTWHENFHGENPSPGKYPSPGLATNPGIAEGKPAPTRHQTNEKHPAPAGNICWRTPEVQEKLIEDLDIPACQLINEAELFRVREFRVNATKVKPGDFAHMPNLGILGIEKLREFPEPGTLDGLGNLEDLNIGIATDGWKDWGGPRPAEVTVLEETLAGLDSLKSLKINSGEINMDLEGGALDGLDQLEYIQLGGIREISADDLAGLSRIKQIKLHRKWPPSRRGEDAPVIPSDLIARLPTVESLEIKGVQWPAALEMNSLEHACLMRNGGRIPDDTVTTVGGTVIQHQGMEHRDGRTFCIMKVGEQIQELPLPTP